MTSKIIRLVLKLLFPFMVLFGIYLIWGGNKAPGGGFQGGAILATTFISSYLFLDWRYLDKYKIEKYEKLIYIIIVMIFMFMCFSDDFRPAFIIILNILIALKVSFAFTTIVADFLEGD
ncbi:MAG: MnhB domain-containing protein [Peptostreptococcaceae bacterium]|jgi:multicomponent Na+:H+ antiporter subunit B|nr:MnhB domain-containing protein [Peptostreptococcaceae bacterium]